MTQTSDRDEADPPATTAMSRTDQERFLADVHVGVLHVASQTGTLAVPVWYDYPPGAGVSVITGLASRKGVAINAAGRFGLVAQVERGAYRYVSVEGPVVESRPCEYERDLVPMAVRYLGRSGGERYASAWSHAGLDGTRVFTMRPERWFAADLADQFAALGVDMEQPG